MSTTPNIPIKTGAGAPAWTKATGTGTQADPFIPSHTIENTALSPVNTALTAALPTGANAIGRVGGLTVEISATLTRPSDISQYGDKDVIANATSGASVLLFPGAGRAGVTPASGYITKALAFTDQPSYSLLQKLHLYHTAPTPRGDNQPFQTEIADANRYIGIIDFPAFSQEAPGGSMAFTQDANIRMPFVIPSGTTIYGIPEAVNGFTPAASQTFIYKLTIEQN